MKQSKFSSPYTLVKDPVESSNLYALYDARNKNTGEFWHAKILHHTPILNLDMQEHVEYNQEVLQNLKEKGHVIYAAEIFIKGEDTYIIQEKYEIKLSKYIEQKGTLPPGEIQRILQDIFEGVCDIYEEQYVHRNLRSEHVVKVTDQAPEGFTWKIQTLVLDNKQFPINTPFTWSRQTASPQDIVERQRLDQDQMDSQIVWNFGYLALEMLMGASFMKNLEKKKDLDNAIAWNKIKELTTGFPNLYELINGCFRQRYKERISLKKFFDLKIFQNVLRPGIGQFFVTASKIFKTNTLSKVQQSVNMKNRNMKANTPTHAKIQKKVSAHDYFNNIETVREQLYDETEKDATRVKFLLEGNKYLPLMSTKSESGAKMLQNRALIDLIFLKLALKFEERTRRANKVGQLDTQRKQAESRIKNYSLIVKNIKEKDSQLMQKHSLQPNKHYNHLELLALFNKLNGYAYTRIQEQCQLSQDEAKLRALAFFGILAYLINMHDWSKLESFKEAEHGQYLAVFDRSSVSELISLSQKLIKQHFQTE